MNDRTKARGVGELLTEKEAAARLRLDPSTLRKWRSQGKGPSYYKVGRSPLYSAQRLESWLRDQERF